MIQTQEVKMREKQEDDDGPPPGWQQPIHTTTPSLPTPPPPRPSDMGQLVCGSCRRLLAYPGGFKHVTCACCGTENLVLQPHQVGQVKCGGCAVLLMYPYGAPRVRCCSCRFETEIGDHNKRPPLSEQLRKPTPPKGM
ncbi:PREDICTED: protein LOL2 isoform X2 [Lupinus angustifolius]|uniref:protein LOL2 isoform X2 n=1 Tax=Lupinus angustifolius TaxID=3871 RepID=UPI00092EF25F|nr:PREDICTED: protein LOL2 isoform X2 [Lupinus angustifolius]